VPRHSAFFPRGRTTPASRRLSTLVIACGVVLLAGCSVPDAAPSGGTATASPQPTAEPSPAVTAPSGPVLVPDGSAADNLELFSTVTASVWNSDARESGRAYVDALVAAGFDKASMQVTEDLSTVGNRAESIQFSVLWGQECLIGQVGPATGEPVAVVVPVLGEGMCLVGQTRPIDW
jgi:hypothetical protein